MSRIQSAPKSIFTVNRADFGKKVISPEQRAKIFAPFAALTGFDSCIRAKETVYTEKRELFDDWSDRIGVIISHLEEGMEAEISFFRNTHPQHRELGEYITVRGTVEEISDGAIIIGGQTVEIEDISDISADIPLTED